MTFSVYLDEELTAKLNRAAKESKARNALTFKGFRGTPKFENHRKALKPAREPATNRKMRAGKPARRNPS